VALLKAVVWPAFLVYHALERIHDPNGEGRGVSD
jgi:hypothetical protein